MQKWGKQLALLFIVSDIIRKMNLLTLSEEYNWIGKVFAYPLALIALIITWRLLSNSLREKNVINFDKYYYVRLKVFSFKAIKTYSIRLIIFYFLFLLLSESVTMDIFSMFIMIIGTLYYIVLTSIALLSGTWVISIENDVLKIE